MHAGVKLLKLEP